MNEIIEDLIKIYLASIDSNNARIYQTVNEKYTIIDRSMLAVYIFVKIIEDRKIKNKGVTEVLTNYILKQAIYGETGNLSFEIRDKTKTELYHKIINELIVEKFEYKNRIMKKLKYNYKNIKLNKYNELLAFTEKIAEFAIFQKMILRGNQEAIPTFNKIKNKIISDFQELNNQDEFYEEKKIIIDLIIEDNFLESTYGNLTSVALSLRDVYRYSTIPSQLPEDVLFHQYTVALLGIVFAEYCNQELREEIDIYELILKSLFHDFSEYKGAEIVTQIKNYNETTKKMFAEIEEADQKDLETKIGKNLYYIILKSGQDAEGYIVEMTDKMLGIMKLWVEVGYFHNYTFIKTIVSIFQERFTRFLKVEKIQKLKNKIFYLDLIREYYIYIKEHLIEQDVEYFLKYFTQKELEQLRKEISLLKTKPELFLK